MNQNDKRVRRTKQALQEALMELLAQKDLAHITVKELTDKADVHRVTFYAHYQDINACYEELKKNLLKDIAGLIEEGGSHNYQKYFGRMVDYFYDHRAFCRLLFTDNSLLETALDVWKEKYLKIWLAEEHLPEVTPDMRYLTSYNIEGCAGIIQEWWRDGFSEPKEKVVGYLKRANRIFDAISLVP